MVHSNKYVRKKTQSTRDVEYIGVHGLVKRSSTVIIREFLTRVLPRPQKFRWGTISQSVFLKKKDTSEYILILPSTSRRY